LFLITLSVVALFDVPESAVFCALSVGNVLGLCTHANVRWNPPRWFTYTFNTIEAHSLHHSATSFEDTRCNFAGTFIVIDRLREHTAKASRNSSDRMNAGDCRFRSSSSLRFAR
jgi:sterol desaturase/sphingolipid hydroxylase (fatty acid hydroxylase superfamily)